MGAKKPATPNDQIASRVSKREVDAAALAATLPADRDRLLEVARECTALYNDAVLAKADFAALIITERYDAVVWKLNGGTFYGCCAGDESAGSVTARYCEATPGTVPIWGQRGEFLITVIDVRCWVKYGGGLGSALRSHFEFNVIDLDGPFISETGYRSHFCSPVGGSTVEDAASQIFADMFIQHRRYLAPEYQTRLANDELPGWVKTLAIPPRRKPATLELMPDQIPAGFELVDVVVTSHQAFVIRKWAALAAGKVKLATSAANPLKTAPLPHSDFPERQVTKEGDKVPAFRGETEAAFAEKHRK